MSEENLFSRILACGEPLADIYIFDRMGTTWGTNGEAVYAFYLLFLFYLTKFLCCQSPSNSIVTIQTGFGMIA